MVTIGAESYPDPLSVITIEEIVPSPEITAVAAAPGFVLQHVSLCVHLIDVDMFT